MLTPVIIMAALAVTGVLSTPADVEPQPDTWTEKHPDTPDNDTEVVISLQPYHLTWKAYKHDYGKVYDSVAEESYRFRVFKSNALEIESHNKLYMSGRVQFYLGLNQFSDMELWEYIEYNKLNRKYNDTENRWGQDVAYLEPANLVIPQTVDWRKKGYVTAVKNQGSCGSCWSFGATGSLEGQHFRKTRKLISLSEQQLVDCSWKFGNHGCDGGRAEWAMSYIRSAGGIQSETTYPYKGKDMVCKSDKAKFVAGCEGFVSVPASENSLKSAVASVGPVSVVIDGDEKKFMKYKGGVYNDPLCSSVQTNHAVLVVGYGNIGGADYWLVKNSWGTTWGNQGYIYMSRNKSNQCGIANRPSYPLV